MRMLLSLLRIPEPNMRPAWTHEFTMNRGADGVAGGVTDSACCVMLMTPLNSRDRTSGVNSESL
jgi:hypothetical protein